MLSFFYTCIYSIYIYIYISKTLIGCRKRSVNVCEVGSVWIFLVSVTPYLSVTPAPQHCGKCVAEMLVVLRAIPLGNKALV